MSPRQITPDFFVSEQLTGADVDQAAGDGFSTIINNRPDGEADDQPSSAKLEAISTERALAYRHLPVIPGAFDAATIKAFSDQLDIGGRVLAFCRTGARAVSLWALAKADELGVDTVIESANQAGYDIAALRPRLEAAARGDRS